MSKGISSFLSAVLLVLIAISIAVIVSGWVVSFSEDRSEKIRNVTSDKFNCQYASLYIKNVSYDCNNACFTGSPYKINATIENIGNVPIDIVDVVVKLDTGQVYTSSSPGQRISSGDIALVNFNDILITCDGSDVTYNITHPNINYIRLYNSTNHLIDTVGPLNGVGSYNKTLTNSSTSYKIEVEDINGEKISEYYPFVSGSSCLATSSLETVTIVSVSCPSKAIDSFYGSDVTFIGCT